MFGEKPQLIKIGFKNILQKSPDYQRYYEIKKSGPDKWQQLERFMPALTNVFDVYEKAKISVKILLDPPFAYNSLKAKEKGLLFVEQPLVSSGQNPFSSP